MTRLVCMVLASGCGGRTLPAPVAGPPTSLGDLARGQVVYTTHCAACHGRDLAGESASSLADDAWSHTDGSFAGLVSTIGSGLDAGCPPWGEALDPVDLERVASFVLHRGP